MREDGRKRIFQSSRNSPIAASPIAGTSSARTHSPIMRLPSCDARRSAASDASAQRGSSATTSSKTDVSTAVTIARPFEIGIDAHPTGQPATSAPLGEDVAGQLLLGDELAVDG